MPIPTTLSEREKEVAALLLQGKSNKQIAQALGISTRTAEFHVSNLYEKLGVASRAEAILRLSESADESDAAPPAGETEEPAVVPVGITGDLRESTGTPAGSVLRETTVAKTSKSSDNDGNFTVPIRRISMRTCLFIAVSFVMLLCLVAGVGMLLFNFRMSATQQLSQNQTAPVMVVEETAPIQPTSTPWVTTPDPSQPTSTPWIVTPTSGGPQPTTTAYAVPLEGGRYSYEGVSIAPPTAVASGVDARYLMETPGDPGGPYWAPHPAHVSLTLEGYPVDNLFFRPVIAVYPVEEYRRLSPIAAETLDQLTALLDQQPADAEKLPFLPVINAGQIFHSNVAYLDFASGTGVRYLAMHSQAVDPVTNENLVYTFQGLTADGSHVVSVVLPVAHPSLPDDYNTPPQEAIGPTYYGDTAAALNAQPDDSFTPDLGQLDELVESIRVQ